MPRSFLVCLIAPLLLTAIARVAAEAPDFETDVAPILVKRCLECHQPPDPAGGLSLTTQQGLRLGGDSGPAIESGNAKASLLLQRVRDGEMPPEGRGQDQRLPAAEIELLARWLDAGGSWPVDRELDWFERTSATRGGRDWWSLQPIVRPEVPELAGSDQVDHPIDAFIGARLEGHGMTPAPRADRRTLLRRLSYDLLGLPPSRAALEAFVGDQRPDAWQRTVDRLLDSPRYGERWARYWLDLARYADTSGYERDQEKPFAWKYRDWVVAALNTDIPFNQFVVHQLAGDEIPDRDEASIIATGFLRLGTWNDEPNDPADYQYDRLEDAVHTTASAFLGVTVKCARCHAHKFDPIEQEDYYRMASAFWAGPIAARGRELLGGPTPSEVGFENVLAWTDRSPDPEPLHVLKNGEREHPLHEVTPATLSMIPELAREFSPPPAGARTSHRRLQLAQWIADPRHPLTARVIVNRLWQHHFGEAIVRTPNNFGFLAAPPTHPRLLDWLAAELLEHGGSLKHIHRLILMSETWRQSAEHPEQDRYRTLDASNRWWWRSLRRRLDAEAIRDSMLSVSGTLDLKMGGESFKPTLSREALEGLSRKSAAWQASPPPQQQRRSLYMFLKRGLLPPLMTTFDFCDPTSSCGQRNVTTVPTQALALLNNPFVHQCSLRLALRITADHVDAAGQVDEIFGRVLKRRPNPMEKAAALDHLHAQQAEFQCQWTAASTHATGEWSGRPERARVLALASLCQVLMNTNEFVFID